MKFVLHPCLIAAVALLGFSQFSHAAIVVRIESKRIDPDSRTTLDVYVSSTDTDTVGIFDYFIEMEPITENGTDLEFAETSLDSERGRSDYIFGNQGFAYSQNRQNNNRRHVAGGDAVLDPVTLTTEERLLTTLDLEDGSAPGMVFGQYRVSLRGGTATQFRETFLPGSTELDIDPRSFSDDPSEFFGSGIVTVTAIPEPSSCLLVAFATLGIILCRRSRVVPMLSNQARCLSPS